MHAPRSTHATIWRRPLAADCSSACARSAPRVHCITNAVAQNFTANVLLAAGCVPSMTLSRRGDRRLRRRRRRAAGQSRHLRRRAARRRPTSRSTAAAGKTSIPWVLDPVFIDRAPPRAEFARALIGRGPSVVRLNRAEFAALAGGEPSTRSAGALCARPQRPWSALSGETDLVTDGARLATHRQRPSADGRVTAMGCAGSALVARLSRGRARRLCAPPPPRC